MQSITKHVFYEGQVQGVGFRYTVHALAEERAQNQAVRGIVRNLFDGRVEVIVSGSEEDVDSFLQSIRDSRLRRYIQRESVQAVHPENPVPTFKGFQIAR